MKCSPNLLLISMCFAALSLVGIFLSTYWTILFLVASIVFAFASDYYRTKNDAQAERDAATIVKLQDRFNPQKQDEEKIKLVDQIVEMIRQQMTPDQIPVMIGTLNRRLGINGFKVADIGHPVFEYKDRYVIYLESNDGKTTVAVPYYKKDLSPVIVFT